MSDTDGVRMLALSVSGELMEVVAHPEEILKALYVAIGCDLVDRVELAAGLDMWLDDEGLCVADPEVNPFATALGYLLAGTEQPFAGVAVLAGERDGDTVSLTAAQRELVSDLVGRLVQLTGEKG